MLALIYFSYISNTIRKLVYIILEYSRLMMTADILKNEVEIGIAEVAECEISGLDR